jgi:hypothetical protein
MGGGWIARCRDERGIYREAKLALAALPLTAAIDRMR